MNPTTRILVLGALLLSVLACNQSVVNTPIRSFDRPSDVALSCVLPNRDDFRVADPLPLSDCTPDNVANLGYFYTDKTTQITATVKTIPTLIGVVANSARGEVAIVDATSGFVIDTNTRVIGYNFLPVGKLPEHVRSNVDGCKAVTANADSCDLALIDLPSAVNVRFENADLGVPLPGNLSEKVVQRIAPMVNGRKLNARPRWIEFSPVDSGAVHGVGQCSGGHYRAWVALPGCQLVVEVSLQEDGRTPGEITRAVRVTRTSTEIVTDLSTLQCNAECSGPVDGSDGGSTAMSPSDLADPTDGSVTDGGVPPILPTTQAYPATIAIDAVDALSQPPRATSGRMFIGDQTSGRISILPIDPMSGAIGAPRSITLAETPLGVNVLRVSPRTGTGQFMYAVAREGTVRVVDLDREVECETNPDPRDPRIVTRNLSDFPSADPSDRAVGCYPLGDPSTPRRAAVALSPGISLQNGALPRDVAFVHVNVLPQDDNISPISANPTLMVGDFAWIIGSDGRASAVNIFDACPAPNIPFATPGAQFMNTASCDPANYPSSLLLTTSNPGRPQPLSLDRLSHRLRELGDRFQTGINCGDVVGSPRLQDEGNPVTVNVPSTTTPAPDAPTDPAGIAARQPKLVSEQLQPPPPAASGCISSTQRSIAIYDIDHVRNETWTLAWEGVLPGTQRALGQVGGKTGDPTHFTDTGGAFCSRGVQAGDKLVFTGCATDADCDFNQECVRDPGAPQAVVNGMCLWRMDKNPTDRARQNLVCGPLLRSVRRYRIRSARQGVVVSSGAASELTDQLVLDEIYQPEGQAFQPPLNGIDTCSKDAECSQVTIPFVNDNGESVNLPTQCLQEAPTGGKRCIRACDISDPSKGTHTPEAFCGANYQCLPSIMGGTRCLRSPIDAKAFGQCFEELQPYEIHAGESFLVTGGSTGVLSELVPDPITRECGKPPISNEHIRLTQSRIPFGPASCPAAFIAANRILDPLEPSVFPDNVCLFSSSDRLARQIHFENPYFAFGLELEPTGLLPDDGMTVAFTIVGGNAPFTRQLAIDVPAQQPRAAITGPDGQFVYIVDEGKQTSPTGLRGQLLRLSTITPGVDRSFVVR